MDSLSRKMKRVIIREIVRGEEAATQLKLLLQKPFDPSDGSHSVSAEELLANVFRSFTHSLNLINSVDERVDSPSPTEEGSRKASLPSTKNKGGRGCYKRRRSGHTWTIISPTAAADDHAWRKYGQKGILNSKFPRSYFRCSRKREEGCKATKQVQRTQENPEMYQTTYIGIHTCKSTPKELQQSVIVDNSAAKQDTTTSPSDYYDDDDATMWSELKDIEPSKASIVPYDIGSDNAGTGSQCLDHEFGVQFLQFDHHSHELISSMLKSE